MKAFGLDSFSLEVGPTGRIRISGIKSNREMDVDEVKVFKTPPFERHGG